MTIYQLFQGLGALKAVMIRLQGSVNHLIPQLEEKERRHNMGRILGSLYSETLPALPPE